MDFSNLSKQQKDRLILIVMVTVLLVVGIGYGIKSVFAISTRVKNENEILEGKISRAERMIGQQKRFLKNAQEISAELKTYIKEAPHEEKYRSWASDLIKVLAKKAMFKIDPIEIQGGATKNKEDTLNIGTSFKIMAHSEYETCLNFLKMMEKEYPLVRVVSIEINPGTDVEIHEISIVIQWPSNLAYLLREKATTKGAKP